MKKIFVVVLGVLFLASCNSKSEGFTINGTVRGDLENGTQVFLKTIDSLNRYIEIDTTKVENGNFTFTGTQVEPKLHYIAIESGQQLIPFFLENGEISLKFQKDSLNHAKLKGTLQNDLFMNFLDESRKLQERHSSMTRDMRSAAQQRDTATATALREEFMEFQEEAKSYNVDFVKENPNALISVLILGDLLQNRVVSEDEVKELFEALSPEMKQSTPGKRIKKFLDQLKNVEIGGVAPEFSAPTPNGDLLALSDVKGKLTLIDFWAAWCRPCRAENPNIVSVYNKYHDKGFNVIGVSLDSRAEDWTNAIEADGLTWNHISNLKRFQDPIAQMYSINAIPAAFLIDENGVIVAKNLRGPALEQKVAELLN
ncbi:TlpA disulfide reductase family protein [Flagellimonas pacifica]|uniref:Peroxiredoxin n=1 Tax=Flagellimonas pacifica TaxID=1247520 RepID=A0A285MS96_9FLAO|nr:TlpA disulfide reductase family protein [Allomuricauda parva]SNZ00045.1 Peroxiredoxin [Allomuricauda parva]